MVSQRILILECDSDRASLGIFSCDGLRLCLHQFAVEHFPPAAITNAKREEAWLENIGTAFRALRKKAKYRGAATVVLPAHLCLTKFLKIPRMEAAQREKILRFEAEQNIPYALSDVVWNSVTVFETAVETEVMLAAVKLDIVDAICNAASESGFEIRAVLPAQCATLAGFKLAVANKAGTYLGVNAGSRATTLTLVNSDRFALRTFALEAPEDGKPKEAEREEFAVVRLQQEIARSLLHFQWRTGMAKPDWVCVTGPGEFPGLADAVGAKLKLPVEKCDLRSGFDCVQVRDLRSGVPDNLTTLTIDLIGAAAAHFDSRQVSLTLLPPRMLERASYRQRRPWLLAAASLALFILLPPAFHFITLRDEAVKKLSAIERELAPRRARDLRIRKNLRQLAEIREKVNVYQVARERRTAWLQFLTGLQTHLAEVEDVWLEKIQVIPPTANAPMKLLLSGRMLDRARPLAKVSPETFTRVNTLLTGLAHASFITAVESERFDNRQPGVLQFDFVLVTDARQPL